MFTPRGLAHSTNSSAKKGRIGWMCIQRMYSHSTLAWGKRIFFSQHRTCKSKFLWKTCDPTVWEPRRNFYRRNNFVLVVNQTTLQCASYHAKIFSTNKTGPRCNVDSFWKRHSGSFNVEMLQSKLIQLHYRWSARSRESRKSFPYNVTDSDSWLQTFQTAFQTLVQVSSNR